MILKPKKKFGQHFLQDNHICEKIANQVKLNNCKNILEIGPGEGALTKWLNNKTSKLQLIEIDDDAILVLNKKFPHLNIIHDDFLKFDLNHVKWGQYVVVGNFPYNISTQILFKILDYRNNITQVVGMFQKEVAERICSAPKSKKYGIPSVLIQAFFDCELLFDVGREHFYPQPNVNSSVIKLTRNSTKNLSCDYDKFVFVVKSGFAQRRKKIKNALKNFTKLDDVSLNSMMLKRAEELSVSDFVNLTKSLFPN
jgi:16S rRNA (adenine1518-N6/adenine1519-N6)-dimethyltransferase